MAGSSSPSNAIIAFWAPFFILHLGGPDTITAYSLEDNELWHRHLLALFYELIAAIYVLFRSLPNTRLLTPTLLIFFVGIIKYVERTYSLYKASSKSFYRSISFAGELQDKHSLSPTLSPTLSTSSLSSTKSELDDLKTLRTLHSSFKLYNTFKPNFVDIEIKRGHHYEAENFLRHLEPKEVLEVLDLELDLAYDELYTKAIVNHSRAGYVLRALCSICIWLAFFLYFFAPKVSFDKVDVTITYVLLAASIILDIIAIVMLMFSKLMVISLLKNKMLRHWTQQLAILIFKIKFWWLKRMSRSREMPQLNLISNCLKNSETNKAPWRRMKNWIEEKLGIVQTTYLFRGGDNEIYTLRALQSIKANQDFMEIIIAHAKIHLGRILNDEVLPILEKKFYLDDAIDISYIELLSKTNESSLETVVFLYHIATQIVIGTEDSELAGVNGKTSEKDVCKYLSNYMMHMVVMQPEKMSTMRPSSAKEFWKDYKNLFEFIHEWGIHKKLLKPNAEVKDVCRAMIAKIFFFRSYSDTLHIAQMLACSLLSIEENHRWQVVTRMWVMLLMQGGQHSKANIHLKQLSKGGEPLTLIWLLTKNFGFGEKDDINEEVDSTE